MNTEAAVALLLTLLQTAESASELALKVSGVIRKAKEQGRDDITMDELHAIVADDDAARALLVQAIQAAKTG